MEKRMKIRSGKMAVKAEQGTGEVMVYLSDDKEGKSVCRYLTANQARDLGVALLEAAGHVRKVR